MNRARPHMAGLFLRQAETYEVDERWRKLRRYPVIWPEEYASTLVFNSFCHLLHLASLR